MRARVRGLGLVVAGLAVMAAAGCGSSSTSGATARSSDPLASLTALQVSQKAEQYLAGRPTLQFWGTVTQSGKPLTIRFTVSVRRGCRATIQEPGKGTIYLLSIRSRTWFKFSNAFWKANGFPAALLYKVAGKYIDASAEPGIGGLKRLCTGPVIQGPVTGKVTKAGFATVNGKRTLVMIDDKGNRMWVTDTATPIVVRFTDRESGTENLYISSSAKSITIKAPTASQIVDLNSLRG